MRLRAQWCESNGCANLFMILALAFSVFFLAVVVLFNTLCTSCTLSLIEFKYHQVANNQL